MRILHVAYAGAPHVIQWTQHFARRGDEVHIASLEYKDVEGVTVHKLSNSSSPTLRPMTCGLQISNLCKQIKPDVIHAHYTTKYAYWAALADVHPLIVQPWGSDVFVESKQSKAKKEYTKFTFSQADVVVCASRHLRNYIGANYNPSAQTLLREMQIGIDLNMFHNRRPSMRRELVVFSPRGRSPHYRQESIETAVRSLIMTDHNIDYLSLSNGPLPTEVMADRYQCSDVVVSIPYTDQFSSCLQEAMACGCIPIVADLPAYHQHLTHGVNARYVSKDATPEEIAREVVWCIEHPEEKAGYVKKNREIAEREFDWDKCITKLEELYEEVSR